MGHGVSICCEACGASEDLELGVGMLFGDPFRIVQSMADKRRRDRILGKLQSNQPASLSVELGGDIARTATSFTEGRKEDSELLFVPGKNCHVYYSWYCVI